MRYKKYESLIEEKEEKPKIKLRDRFKNSMLAYRFFTFFDNIRNKINNANFGSLIIIMMAVFFYAMIIAEFFDRQKYLISAENVEQFILKYSATYQSVTYILFWLFLIDIWIMACNERRPATVQVFPNTKND